MLIPKHFLVIIERFHMTSRRPYWCSKTIERFHSGDQHLCKFTGTKESVYIRKEINSKRIGLEHQHGRRFTVLEH